MRQTKAPNTRKDWHGFYVSKFNKSEAPQAAHLAMWYQLLHLAFDEQPVQVPDPHAWLDAHIIEQAAAYGMSVEAKAYLFNQAAKFNELLEAHVVDEPVTQ